MQEDHKLCVVEEVSRMIDKGYTCYLEYTIENLSISLKNKKLIVDIFAKKKDKEVIIEVGYLSGSFSRLRALRESKPKAKIIWVLTIGKNLWQKMFCLCDNWAIPPSILIENKIEDTFMIKRKSASREVLA